MANTTISPSAGAATLTGNTSGNWPSTGFLYLSEFGTLLDDASSGTALPRCPTLTDQVIPFGGISAASAAFTPATRLVRVHTDSICAVKVGGTAPVAAAKLGGTSRMAAGQTEYFAVKPGDAVAVITTA